MKITKVATEIAKYSGNFDNHWKKLADKIQQGKSTLIMAVIKIWYNKK